MSWTDLTRRQAGLVTRSQLRCVGIARGTVDEWLAGGRLEATGIDGVYRLGGAPSAAGESAWLAVLGTRSPLSYTSAGQWWDMDVPDDGHVHITRFDRRRLDWPAGVRVHRVAIDETCVVRHRGLWVTTRSETVLDCMGWLSPGRAAVLGDRALQQGWLTTAHVTRRLENSPGRWGNRQLRRLALRLGDRAHAESERRLHAILRRAGISGWVPHLNVVVAGRRYELDVALPDARIAIEVDGYAYHSGDDRFQRDRTRQNALVGAGWRVLRFTWTDLADRPDYVIAQILQLLAA